MQFDGRVAKFNQGDILVTVVLSEGWKARKARVYAWGAEPVSFDHLPDGWQFNKDPEIVKECKRLNRIEIANMRALVAEAVAECDNDVIREVANGKMSFSRKAGCSCGCSPGFVLDRLIPVQVNGRERYVDQVSFERVS